MIKTLAAVSALTAALLARGAVIETNARVTRILHQNGKANGITLADGREITARRADGYCKLRWKCGSALARSSSRVTPASSLTAARRASAWRGDMSRERTSAAPDLRCLET